MMGEVASWAYDDWPADVVEHGDPADGLNYDLIRERFPRLDWHAVFAEEAGERWIVFPLLAEGRLTALYSGPKIGKSLLLLEIAVAVSRGLPVLGVKPARPYRVLYVDMENDPRGDVVDRLLSMQIEPDDLDRLDYLSFPAISALDSPAGGRELLAAVKAYGSEVVVIDTVSRVVAGKENENDTWLAFYRCTGLPLKRAGVAMVRLDHAGKDAERGQRGGSAKEGDVDAVWRLSEVTRDQVYRLDCTHARMQISEKAIVLHREADPLRHRVDALGAVAAWDAKVSEVVAVLDREKVPTDVGRPGARDVLSAVGISASNAAISEAVRRRKPPSGAVPKITGQLDSDTVPNDHRTAAVSCSRQGADQQEHLSPRSGDTTGTPTPDRAVPSLPSIGGDSRGDRGQRSVSEP